MAEESKKKEERVRYKFGSQDIDLTNYLHNLDTNVLSYLDSKRWNDLQKEEFKNAFNTYYLAFLEQLKGNTSRFSTDAFGTITDLQGKLSNSDNDSPDSPDYYYNDKGKQISTSEYEALKDRKKKKYNNFLANREVAGYFNTIGKALRDSPLEKKKEEKVEEDKSNVFDIAKHGFMGDWLRTYNPTNSESFDLAPLLKVDEADYSSTTNRAAQLKRWIDEYIPKVQDWDFTGSSFSNKNTYVQALLAASDSLKDGYNPADAQILFKAGISDKFLIPYFSTPTLYPVLDPEGITSSGEADTMSDLLMVSYLGTFRPLTLKNLRLLKKPVYDKEKVGNLLSNLYGLSPALYLINELTEIKKIVDYLRGKGPLFTKVKGGDVLLHIANNLHYYVTELMKSKPIVTNEGFHYIPYSYNKDNNSILVYSPSQNIYKEVSAANLKLADETNMRPYLRDLLIQSYKDQSGITPSWNIQKGQEGLKLSLPKEQIDRWNKKLEEDLREAEKLQRIDLEDTRTLEEKEAGKKKISEGLSGTDIARLAAIGMDLTSAISSFVPGVGTAASGLTGIGSTLTTFGADIAEDGFLLSDLGNAAVGLGVDIVGLIPGFGTAGKATKIGKLLVKVAPFILGGLLARNALSASSAASWKKITDGKFKDLTVDDLRNLANGIATFTSLSNLAGIRMKSSAMKSATKTGDKLLLDKTGEMLRVTPEQLESIKKAKSVKEANEILQKIPGYEGKELASTFRGGLNFTRLWDNNPTVAEHYDWSKLKDTRFSQGKLGLPSDALIFRASRSSNIGDLNWHFKVTNPYFKYLQKVELPTSTKLTSVAKPKTSKPDSLKPKSALTETPKLEASLVEGILPPGKIDWDEIDARRKSIGSTGSNPFNTKVFDATHPYFKKEGGILERVRKFQNAGSIKSNFYDLEAIKLFQAQYNEEHPVVKPVVGGFSENTNLEGFDSGELHSDTGAAIVNKSNTYTFDTTARLLSMLDRLKSKTITTNDIASYLDRHWGMYKNWDPERKLAKNDKVSKYLADYQRLGLNDEIIQPKYSTNYTFISGTPTSGDSKDKNWTADGLFSQITDDRRVLAREGDYNDNPDLLKEHIKLAADAGYDYYLDKDTGYYKLREKNPKSENSLEDNLNEAWQRLPTFIEDMTKSETDPAASTGGASVNPNAKMAKGPNYSLLYGLPRLLLANRANKRETQLYLDAEKPFLLDPLEVHRNVYSDLGAEILGERNAANLRRLAGRPTTSDMSLWNASQLLAESLAQKAIWDAARASDLRFRETSELAWLQEKENATKRHATAMENRNSLLKTALNIAKIKAAYENKKFTNLDTFLQQLEYEDRLKKNKVLAKLDALWELGMTGDIYANPNDKAWNSNQATQLSEAEKAIWEKVLAGTLPSSLSKEDLNLYQSAYSKVRQIISNRMASYYGFAPYNRSYFGNTLYAPKTVKSNKTGGTIKARTKEAEMFLKQIKDYIDRNEKVLDRVSKSMYRLIKSSMVK